MNIKKQPINILDVETSIFTDYNGGLIAFHGNNTSDDDWRSGFNSNIQLINSRINNIKKELTYGDLYRITQVANNSTEVRYKASTLNPGETLVLNTNTYVDDDGTTYSRGDTLTKLSNNDLLHVPARSSGYYYPAYYTSSQISTNPDVYTYTLYYAFSSVAPSEGASVEISNNSAEPSAPAANMHITLQQQIEDVIYYEYQELEFTNNVATIAFDKQTRNNDTVLPFIRFYCNNEEVYLDYTAVVTNNQWTITVTNGYSTTDNKLYILVK